MSETTRKVKILSSSKWEDFKKANGIVAPQLFESKTGGRYIVLNGDAIMLTRDCDLTQELVITKVEGIIPENLGEVWSFIGNETRKVIGTL